MLSKANKSLFMKYRVDMTNSLTVSGLSLSVFMSKYYDNNIPEISQSSMYKDIKLAYYGGMTEVYKPHGKNLYYYDVNSLYPAVAKHDMPGLLSRKILVTGDTNIDALFGFYLVKVDATNVSCQYLGLLPFRGKGLMFPPWKMRRLIFLRGIEIRQGIWIQYICYKRLHF